MFNKVNVSVTYNDSERQLCPSFSWTTKKIPELTHNWLVCTGTDSIALYLASDEWFSESSDVSGGQWVLED